MSPALRTPLPCATCVYQRRGDHDYPCQDCGGRSFTTPGRLHRHLRRRHRNSVRQIECTQP